MSNMIQRVFAIAMVLTLCFCAYDGYAANVEDETEISGIVTDAQGVPLAGVNVRVDGKVIGTATNPDGTFSLTVQQDPPLTLIVSIVGFQSKRVEITESVVDDLEIVLEEETISGGDVVVSASRVEESILEAPVTIERQDVVQLRTSASDDYYKTLANLKGVDMTTSSINFQIVNARGFNSTGNTRMVQLTDGMDTQAPALNFPIGNLNGPSQLDVESMEFLPGASSALYGPNAFNGILLVNSKDPFRYPGLSVMVKSGINHIDSNQNLGEPENAQPMYEAAIRYAKSFNNKFAFKLNFSYSEAQDWVGINYTDKNSGLNSGLSSNPAYDGVHTYGDDGTFNIGLLAYSDSFVQNLANQFFGGNEQQAEQYALSNLPAQPVARTGYQEQHLVDHDAKNLKFGTALNYRINDNIEASYNFNYGYGTSVYSGAQRYSLSNFNISQHKLQLDGDNFMLKAYGTFENSGDSYIADFVGFAVNDAYMPTTQWYGTYGIGYLGYLLQQQLDGNNNPDLNTAHLFARNTADNNRYEPGSPQFEAAKEAALQGVVPNGARFDDQSRFFHTEGLYNFKNEIDFMDLQMGLSFRQYQLRSNGTIFDDAGGVEINEFGGFLQGSKSFLDDRLDLTASLRYDKNENFDGQFNPRLSTVINVAENQNIRASYQTGFRNPTTQGQYIDLNVLTARLLGGLPFLAEKYSIEESSYTLESVNAFTEALLQANTPQEQQAAAANLVQYNNFEPVKPEQIQSFEIGYKGLLGEKLFFDMAYYYNIYNDFIAQFRVRQVNQDVNGDNAIQAAEILDLSPQTAPLLLNGSALNTFQVYTNVDEKVESQGAVFGFDYSLPRSFKLGANYNWNQLITDRDGEYIFDYNTPEHKFNVSFSNRRITENLGFNVTYRWQDEFEWVSSFADGTVPAVSTVDAQVSYKLNNLNSIVKLGGSNITNNRHFLNYGGPNLGAIYYVSITFDEFLN
ncbi:TonB-dependent receptor [Gracilimonas amylolytica]|uniref:TonB-dependent receptor n=1 Tax=Gracilimonas amylolytica TaxID=1749045 RepID=UPI0018E4A497|nr:TonB-dependent receptor [Gracilimonas amylolytica]